MDNAGTLLRTIQYKGRTASLVIKVTQLNGVQKQVGLWCGCLRRAPLGSWVVQGMLLCCFIACIIFAMVLFYTV